MGNRNTQKLESTIDESKPEAIIYLLSQTPVLLLRVLLPIGWRSGTISLCGRTIPGDCGERSVVCELPKPQAGISYFSVHSSDEFRIPRRSEPVNMPRLLIVEDQPILLEDIRRGLEAEGYEVVSAGTGRDGLRLCISVQPDAVILDLMLPDGDGLELLTTIRAGGFHGPVMIVSARDTVDHRITGLNMGADDYLIKPFVFSELLARVRALLRRNTGSVESTLRIDDIVLDQLSRTVTQGNQPIELTTRQFDVLAYLLKHKNEVVSREMMARDIWHAETATWTNLIEVQVNRLRNKLENQGHKLRLHTIRGEGYLLGERCS